jgi:hypothetical protein
MTAAKLSDPPNLTDEEREAIAKDTAINRYLSIANHTEILIRHVAQTTAFKIAELIDSCRTMDEVRDVLATLRDQGKGSAGK